MKTNEQAITLDTEPTKEVVVDSLTRDISPEACVFDLIDNAIDAATEKISVLSGKSGLLAASYANFEIALVLNEQGCTISDNCGGIEPKQLKENALRFGQPSLHAMGIGVFGVGLNRALFKLGKVSRLTTDTGRTRYEVPLNADNYLKQNGWFLKGYPLRSIGTAETIIEIKSPSREIARWLGSSDTHKLLYKNVGRRYGAFIKKGLSIKINGTLAKNEEIKLRTDGKFKREERRFKEDGVDIHIVYGEHYRHKFKDEKGYNLDTNKELTEEFGWSVLCNGRAIVLSDQGYKTGWEVQFHSQFYGFVGVVNFICNEPSKLPWNTSKTDVDLNNPIYQVALQDMRQSAEKWRKNTGVIKAKRQKAQKASEKAGKKGDSKKKLANKSSPTIKIPLGDNVLSKDVDEKHCTDKHLNLVHEAKFLDLRTLTYSGLALIRMLFEVSVIKYLSRHKKYRDYRNYTIEQSRAKYEADKLNGKDLGDFDEKNVAFTLDSMLNFILTHPDILGEDSKYLVPSLNQFKKHKPKLNGVLHQPLQAIDKTVAFDIRNEVVPLLRHLIEH